LSFWFEGRDIKKKMLTVQEETVEEVREEEEKDKQSFLSGLKEKFFGKKEETQETEKKTESTGSTEIEEDIPDEFTQAALKAGWTKEDVVEFAGNYKNDQLVALIPYLAEEKKEEKETKFEKIEQSQEKNQEVKLEDKNLEAVVQQLTKAIDAKYQEKFAETEKRLQAYEQERSTREQKQYVTTAEDFFDRAAKDFPVFGQTKELLRFPQGTPQAGQVVPAGPAYDARNAVWKTAVAFHTMGESWENSLKEAMDWYKGKSMEKEIHSKVVRDLKSNEKRLSPKRTEHKVEKKYANEQDEKADIILSAARSAGVKGV
jgi:hypothetical protein